MVYVHQSKLGDDGLEEDAIRKFGDGENVGELYLLSDNVAIELNVLGLVVEAQVVSYVPC